MNGSRRVLAVFAEVGDIAYGCCSLVAGSLTTVEGMETATQLGKLLTDILVLRGYVCNILVVL